MVGVVSSDYQAEDNRLGSNAVSACMLAANVHVHVVAAFDA